MKAHIYLLDGEWCYSLWSSDDEFDSSDTIGVDDASEEEARQELIRQLRDAGTELDEVEWI